MQPRLHQCDPDYRRTPKTDRYCWHCQRDIKHESVIAKTFVCADPIMCVVHPDDSHMVDCSLLEIGPECLKKIPFAFIVRDTQPPQ